MDQIGKNANEAMFQLRQLSLSSPSTLLFSPPSNPPHPSPPKKKGGRKVFLPGNPPRRHFALSGHTHSEGGEENRSATSVFPFSSTVMNRELCKQWSNLRTGKLDGQSGGPVLFA